MLEDKQRWNKKYETAPMPGEPIKILQDNIDLLVDGGLCLDIACGKGRHTNYLASLGFKVDAVDYSDLALASLRKDKNITPLDLDLDHYEIEPSRYDMIICTNFLSRRLFPYIKAGLKRGGYLFFQTFVEHSHIKGHDSSNKEYLLRTNELLHSFIGLKIFFYEEKEIQNLRGEMVMVATLMAQG